MNYFFNNPSICESRFSTLINETKSSNELEPIIYIPPLIMLIKIRIDWLVKQFHGSNSIKMQQCLNK